MVTPSQASLLRLISIGDEDSINQALGGSRSADIGLDGRTTALVRLASLISRDSALPAYQRSVQAALDAGATVDEILSLLIVLAQPAGSTAVITAAPKLSMALGYDVEAGLEELTT
ncbi:MAG: carboxymuconolactone decarboxylase family protein [Candidatus Limnocylindrales bacterium]